MSKVKGLWSAAYEAGKVITIFAMVWVTLVLAVQVGVSLELDKYDKKHQQAIEQCTTQAEWTPVTEVRI